MIVNDALWEFMVSTLDRLLDENEALQDRVLELTGAVER